MKRRERVVRAAVLAAIAAASVGCMATGCSSSEKGGSGGAASALRDATGIEWIVATDPTTGVVTFAAPKNGAYALPGGGALEQATLAFLEAQKAPLKMHAPKTELTYERTSRGADGTSHVRFLQKANGVPVFSGLWIAHFDSGGRLTSMSGRYVVDAHESATAPTVTPEAAQLAARNEVARQRPSASATTLTAKAAELEIFSVGGVTTLAWRVRVAGMATGAPVAFEVHVDANSGAIRHATNLVHTARATGRLPQTYPPFDKQLPDIGFFTSDDAPAKLTAAGPADTPMEVYSGGLEAPQEVVATSAPGAPWTDATTPAGAAIAAQAHGEIVLRYLLEHEKDGAPYRSVDGSGLTAYQFVNAVLPLGDGTTSAENAFWDGEGSRMAYGDGNAAKGLFPYSGSLDVVAHEFFHGVTQYTSALDNVHRETAALNESLSDTFAALVSHRVRGDEGAFTYSEDLWVDGVPDRSMIEPDSPLLHESRLAVELGYTSYGHSDVETMRAADAEAHLDSNVSSHAFYLLTHGGTHAKTRYKVPCGIGWAAADRLYWALETQYIQPSETFEALARSALTAARTMGINERPIACAWVAVKVLTEDEVKTAWNVTCEKDEEAGAPDASDNVLVTQPAQLVECSQSLTGPGTSLTE